MAFALVTGATGFIGRSLVGELARNGHDFAVLVRPGRSADVAFPSSTGVTVVEDPGAQGDLRAALAPYGVSDVIHLATHFVASHRAEDINPMIDSNIAFGTRLAEAVAHHDRPVRFLNIGTVWQHFSGAAYDPVSLYAATKQAYEDILSYYSAVAALEVRTLVLPDTYGPNDPRPKILTLLIEALATGVPLAATSGTGVLDLVHVDDVVNGILRAVDPNLGPGRWSLTSSEGISVRDLAERIQALAKRPVPVTWAAKPDRPRQMTSLVRAAAPLPDWNPTTPLDNGLRSLLIESGILPTPT